MPRGVVERGVEVIPTAGVVYQNHQSNRGASENIQRIITLIHSVKIMSFGFHTSK